MAIEVNIRACSEDTIICDFCSDPKPYASYPAQDMDASNILGLPNTVKATSVGEWCACKECYDLIEKDDYEALSLRSVNHWPWLTDKADAFKYLRALHLKFREWRLGPPKIL